MTSALRHPHPHSNLIPFGPDKSERWLEIAQLANFFKGIGKLRYSSSTDAPKLSPRTDGLVFGASFTLLVLLSAVLSGTAPGWFTIATVVVFGGAHNWIEFRYFLSRLPSRFGPLLPFFVTSCAGVLLLSAMEITLMLLNHQQWISGSQTRIGLHIWNELLILWMSGLSFLRYKKQTEPLIALPLALVLSLANLLSAEMFIVALTFLHPIGGLWIFERELRRTRKPWLKTYHRCLFAIPPCVVALIYCLHGVTLDHVSTKFLSANANSGFSIFPDDVASMFMALYGFLQMVHYGIWVVALPLATESWRRWRLDRISIVRKRPLLAKVLALAIPISGVLAIPVLWTGYGVDYATTNEVYITIATLHVIAELPFLFWMVES